MDLLFQLSLIVIVSLAIRLALAFCGWPRRLTELAAVLAVLVPVAMALQISYLYFMMDLLTFVFSLFLVGLFLIGLWIYVIQPMMEAAETGGMPGTGFATWNLRWDYLSIFVLAVPVFLLILTYHYYSNFFDFTVARMVPLAVLGYMYYYAVLKKW